jgi:hypothetical protein
MKRSPRRVGAALAALAAVTFVAACGDDDATTPSAPTTGSVTATTSTESTESTETTTADTTGGSAATTPDEGSASDNKSDYVDALAANIDDNIGGSADIPPCIASAIVDAIGFDAIRESGMSPETFTRQGLPIDQSKTADLQAALVACGDIADAYISAETASDAQKTCERGVLTNELVAELLATQLSRATPSEQLTAAMDQATKCSEGGTTVPATTG